MIIACLRLRLLRPFNAKSFEYCVLNELAQVGQASSSGDPMGRSWFP